MTELRRPRRPETRKIALAATLSASAALISVSGLSVPFPPLPFLQFDAAEVPDVLAFFLLGPTGGVVVTSVHWILLNLHAGFDPVIGPTMKFLAVFGTMLGLYVGSFLPPALSTRRRVFFVLLSSGLAVRFLIMIPPTFLLYYFISPTRYLTFAAQALSAFGIHVSGVLAAATVVTIITGLYNIIHAVFTISTVWVIYGVAGRMGALREDMDWMRVQLRPGHESIPA
jgi:riboflavin transporter FmnP